MDICKDSHRSQKAVELRRCSNECMCKHLDTRCWCDVLKIAIANLGKHVNQKFRPMATVHDELIFEALEEKAEGIS